MPVIPTITVVIPLYNKAPHVARALNSVLAQTFNDFEVIVIDDGSTDDGAVIVKEFEDPRIRLIQQKNQGVSAARNKGIDESRAELIAFLDADDEWLPEFLETIVRIRKKYPEAGLYGTAYEIHVQGSIVKRTYAEDEGERLLSSYFKALVDCGYNTFNSSSFAAPKKALIAVGNYPLGVKWNEDGTLWGKIALKFKVAYSPKICSIYHLYSINNSTELLDYLENPFPQYVSTISSEELLRRDDAEYLREYCDFCRLSAIWQNIYSGHGMRTRQELRSVNSSRYAWWRCKLHVLSYVPEKWMRLIRKNAKTLSYLKIRIVKERW